MLPKLDAKFYGDIFKAKDGSLVPDDAYVVFLAQDDAFAAILPLYHEQCSQMGCDAEQLGMVKEMIDRVQRWRGANADKCHPPGAHGEETLNDT